MPGTMFTRAGATALVGVAALVACVSPACAQEASASGEVVRVDAANGKVAIKHGAISELDLPAMTLVYRIAPALLAGIQAGDQVKFTAQRQDGKYVITKLSK